MTLVKKINSIANMAIFKEFKWKDKNLEFKKINIIYGRNYSGKTTLSRIFRAFEIGSISEKYSSSTFDLCLSNSSNSLTNKSLKDHGQVIRIFNKDFIQENLKFIFDEKQNINSFAILGEKNINTEKDIQKYKTELTEKSTQYTDVENL